MTDNYNLISNSHHWGPELPELKYLLTGIDLITVEMEGIARSSYPPRRSGEEKHIEDKGV